MKILKPLNFINIQNLKSDKVLLYAFVALGLTALLIRLLDSEPKIPPESSHESADVDTVIPAGFMLVPIQLSNAEALTSLIGQFAVVDLYTVNEKDRTGVKVASAVRLIRAPLDPQQFAVLVREDESSKIVSYDGRFFAALKNRDDKKSLPARKNPLIITYGG